MSLRKVAALLAAFGLLVGLFGSGVAAQFADSLTASESINVGSFGCIISDTSAGTIAGDQKSVHYSAPEITSSAAGSAPLNFTVESTGSIPVKLHVTQTVPMSPFTSLLADPVADVTLNTGGTHSYAAGLQWGQLTNANLGATASIVYSIACVEADFSFTSDVFPSTNAANRAGGGGSAAPGGYVDATAGEGTVTLTFHKQGMNGQWTCWEYRYDGNSPEQRLSENGGVNYNPDIHDGLWPYTCLNTIGTTDTVVLGPTIQYAEVRLSFGAETDERFDWTRFDALP